MVQLCFEDDWENRLAKEEVVGNGVGGTSERGSSSVDVELAVLTVEEELKRRGSSKRDRRLRKEADLGRKESDEGGVSS